jgi:hypothetical protein
MVFVLRRFRMDRVLHHPRIQELVRRKQVPGVSENLMPGLAARRHRRDRAVSDSRHLT